MKDAFDTAYTDAKVAAVAAGSTVVLTVVLYLASEPSSVLVRIAPLAVYFGYLFFGKGETGSAVENPRYWIIGTALLTVGLLAYALFA
jgi:hypothetical protein